ncbi:multicopper oxidase domain-containing protein [Nonomuraea polychroma]|uniref:multicopper oxidase domain-containing protein n=1 Tax=Nonomuraea polychroma TaxID=46176 RepID=UPI001F4E4834|nr:multicopper oxidase domain-containing protein [Nonomuraea polychroma]
MHLAHFQVLARNGRPPAATDGGWKDTVDVRPYEVVDVLARFHGYRGRYMLHCHNLETRGHGDDGRLRRDLGRAGPHVGYGRAEKAQALRRAGMSMA